MTKNKQVLKILNLSKILDLEKKTSLESYRTYTI